MHRTSGAWQVTLGATVDEHAAKNNWNIINRESQERGPFPKKENILFKYLHLVSFPLTLWCSQCIDLFANFLCQTEIKSFFAIIF